MVCKDNTNRERNKKKWADSQQCASDKKKILVMSLHNTSKNIFFFIENKINRLVVRWVCDNNHNTNKDNFYFYFLKKIDFIIQIVKNKKQKLHKSYREYKEEKTLSK